MKSQPFVKPGFPYLLALVLAGVSLLLTSLAQGQERGPQRVLQDFYQWYVQTLAADADPFNDKRAELKKYATDRLIRQVEKARKDGSLGADPFLEAQDFDKGWAKNIKVSGEKIDGQVATANVELKGPEMGTKKLAVTLRQEAGSWKVDKVAAR